MLPYAEGASWDASCVCLPRTRTVLIEKMWSWIQDADDKCPPEIFMLCDGAGTGKTTLAHTIAQRCHESGVAVACFFFDHDVAERNNPRKLFSTVARLLA